MGARGIVLVVCSIVLSATHVRPYESLRIWVNFAIYLENIGTLSVQELFFQLIGWLGLRVGVSPVGMVELLVHGASLTT